MKNAMEWLKDAVLLCSKAVFIPEDVRTASFKDIEERYSMLSDEAIKYVIEIFEREFMPNDRVYVYSWLCSCIQENHFGESLVRSMVEGEFELRTSILFECKAAVHGANEWKERYELRKKNINMLREVLGVRLPYRKIEERNKKEIVIITEQVLGELHAPTKIVLETIRTLQNDFGYNVTLIACPLNVPVPIDVWGENQWVMHTGIEFEEKFKVDKFKYKDTEINCCITTFDGDFKGKYETMLNLIYSINPIFVFGYGVNNPIADMCNDFTTVINEGMSKKCPVSVADILIRNEKCDTVEEEVYKNTLMNHQKQVFLSHVEPITQEEVKGEHTRKLYNLPEEAFIMCIVGNRLDEEIDNAFIQMMARVMQKCKNVHLAVIGETHKSEYYFNDEIFDGRIHYLGFCRELAGTYGVLDLYVNLFRQGGGWSGGIAILSEIPVVTLRDCDVAAHTGENFTVEDRCRMEEEIVRLATDKQYYALKKDMAVKRKTLMQSSGKKEYIGELLKEVYKIMESK